MTVSSMARQGSEYVVLVRPGETFDRFQLKENTLLGQRVRGYTIESRPAGRAGGGGGEWQHIVSGLAIGTKRIVLLPGPVTVPVPPNDLMSPASGLEVRLRVVQSVAVPVVSFFGVFKPCFPNATTEASAVGTAAADTAAAAGHGM